MIERMQWVIMQALLLACSLALSYVMAPVHTGVPIVVCVLAAICLLSVTHQCAWWLATLINTVGCVLMCAVPGGTVFLPSFGADAGMRWLHAPTRRWRAVSAIPTIAAFVPLVIGSTHALISFSVAIWTVLTTFVSVSLAIAHNDVRRYQSLADSQRKRLRLIGARVGDLESSRTEDLQRARLRERTRIAREIHDNVGHLLTSAIMLVRADQVVAQSTGDTLHAEQFEQVGTQLDEAMTMIRRSVHDLKDQGTDFAAMVEDAVAVAERTDLDVQVINQVQAVPSAIAHCFTAVIRESLANTMRHGTAHCVRVKVNDLPGLWQCIVQDDGGSANTASSAHTPGIGLADIEERARALGGTAVCGWHGMGWRVFVSIPKPQEAL